ncbi:MAG: RNA repair transcriptional activator RtcR [Myxococcales bacterium]|nr:RNA repair transcriptional activator RtcR [Myxococcales bacterium]
MDKPITIVGFYGATLDAGSGPRRWDRWRPTVGLFHHDELQIRRLVLFTPPDDSAQTVLADVRRLSPHTELDTHSLPITNPWDFETVYEALHDFVRQHLRADDDEEIWVHLTTGTHVAQICLFLLTEARFLPGKLLQSAPPSAAHPRGRYDVIALDLARYDRIAERYAREQERSTSFLKGGIPTRNRNFNALIEQIEQVATASSEPLLLTGPTGAGKTRLARRIYELKRTRGQLTGPMVEVNCATLRGDQAMSTLFGHRRGAFTSAVADREGLLLTADSGLLFLDEIGELGLDEQAMLLRALEDHSFLPVGADAPVTSRFQLIAGTNQELRDAVARGRFRRDLLARIDLWHFALPGLLQRRQDIEPNLDHELEAFAARTGRRVAFNRQARDVFLDFAHGPDALWIANFRDLRSAVTRMATLSPRGRIGVQAVRDEIARLRSSWGTAPGPDDPVATVLGDDRAQGLDRFDRVQLADVLRVCAASRSLSEAGRTLFAVSRSARRSVNDADRLRKYLARFELTFAIVQGALTQAATPRSPLPPGPSEP